MAYSSIVKPSVHFNTYLYTGNGATSTAGTTARTLTGVGFQPDWVWVKERSNTEQHFLQDAVRGASKVISSNTAAAETDVLTGYSDGGINGFVSDGFTLGSGTGGNANNINTNNETYVAWNWKANGQGSSNTDGSINTTYTSANTTSGISIIKYTGNGSNATVGHGLGVAPKMVMVKSTSHATDFMVGHDGLDLAGGNPWHKYIYLNDPSGEADANTFWNDTAPTSSLVNLGTHSYVNQSNRIYIMYAFAEKKGYCKMGNYKGNGNANGTFVYCGFKPAMIMIKFAGSSNWRIFDSKRIGYNIDNNPLFPNVNLAEGTDDNIDILSNGFKFRTTDGALNGSGNAYIFTAFAEQPLVANSGTDGVPATAR
jgi:hypothetical protein